MHSPWVKNLVKAESVCTTSVSSNHLTEVLNAYLTSFQTLGWLSYNNCFAAHINRYTLMELCVCMLSKRVAIIKLNI